MGSGSTALPTGAGGGGAQARRRPRSRCRRSPSREARAFLSRSDFARTGARRRTTRPASHGLRVVFRSRFWPDRGGHTPPSAWSTPAPAGGVMVYWLFRTSSCSRPRSSSPQLFAVKFTSRVSRRGRPSMLVQALDRIALLYRKSSRPYPCPRACPCTCRSAPCPGCPVDVGAAMLTELE